MKNLIFGLMIIFLFFGCSGKNIKVVNYKQDLDYLLKETKPLKVDMKSFDSRYFMPWEIESIGVKKSYASWANRAFARVGRYYGQNKRLWDENRVKNLIKSTNFTDFNKAKLYAITIRDVQVRNLPTNKPFMRNPKLAGEGFAFDYMQNTHLHVNTPLFVSHFNSDGSWAYIQNPSSLGWIPTGSFRVLNAKQRSIFIKSKKIVITKDKTAIYSKKQNFILHAKVGAIFPYKDEDEDFYHSFVYTKYANKIEVMIPKKRGDIMPLVFDRVNILKIGNSLLGELYGWGGFLNSRDCSAMTKDYFVPFGVWIPRNSAGQKRSGEYIPLDNLSDREKEKRIIEKGIAFESLIYLRGHIMLYVGVYNGKVMVMHNLWGIRTQNSGVDGRYIIGKSIISDLYLGANLPNLKKGTLLISRVKGLVVKPNMPPINTNNFVKAYPDIVKFRDNILYFADGKGMIYDDFIEKNFRQKLENPSIKDTISIKYKAFEKIEEPSFNEDAGRFRSEKLLEKLYGKNRKEIEKNLVKLDWIDGTNILFNKKQNAANQLQKVINELRRLPKKFRKYLINIAGTYNYRKISGTNRLSAHSFGIAVDINVKNSSYWKWDRAFKYKNKIPQKIVDIFEKYGFIWGGRWYHYDTMHFEYRPEFFDTID